MKHGCFTVTMAPCVYINWLTFKPVSPTMAVYEADDKKEKETDGDQSQGKTRQKSDLAVQQCMQTVAWRNADYQQQSCSHNPALCFYSRQAALCMDLISPFTTGNWGHWITQWKHFLTALLSFHRFLPIKTTLDFSKPVFFTLHATWLKCFSLMPTRRTWAVLRWVNLQSLSPSGWNTASMSLAGAEKGNNGQD